MSLLASGVLANATTPYFGSGGGGGSTVILNNAKTQTYPANTWTLQPNIPLNMGGFTVTADYTDATTSTLLPIAQTQLADLEVTNTNITPETGDTLTFYVKAFSGTPGVNPPVNLTPAVVLPYTSFSSGTLLPIQFNAQGYTGVPVAAEPNTYTLALWALYGTSNTTPMTLTNNSYPLNGQVLACVR